MPSVPELPELFDSPAVPEEPVLTHEFEVLEYDNDDSAPVNTANIPDS